MLASQLSRALGQAKSSHRFATFHSTTLALVFTMAATTTKRNVLIPIDDSPNCTRAFDWYITHLKKPDDFLFFVHVIEPVYTTPAVGLAMESPPLLVDDMTRIMEESISSGKKLGLKYMNKAKEAGLECKAFLHVDTKPGNAIVKSANDHKADAIIIGSRGLGAIKRTFLGSVSDYIVHNANVPVVIVPPSS